MTEKKIKPSSGYFFILIHLVALIITVFLLIKVPLLGILGLLLTIFSLKGFLVIKPNEACVLVLFGEYEGTIYGEGFYWVNPLSNRTKVSLRARNLNGEILKVNDKQGNPVKIAAVIVWKIVDTTKAIFNVDDYELYVRIQSEASVRDLASIYPYDNFEEDNLNEVTLRSGANVVNNMLESTLSDRLHPAGIAIVEARISHLAYAEEIASAMLQRQQARAIISARREIVEGAVGMVEMALHQLNQKNIVNLSDEKKVDIVSSLLIVLCSDRSVNPVIQTGNNQS